MRDDKEKLDELKSSLSHKNTAMFCGLGFLVVFLLILGLFSIAFVKTGHVKVVTRFGKVTGRVLYPGAHLKMPFIDGTIDYSTKKVTYETTGEEKQKTSQADYKDYPVDTNTADGQQVDVYYTVRFSVDPNKVMYIAQNIGSEAEIVEKIIKTESRIWIRNIPREYDAASLYTGDVVNVQNAIFDKLTPLFAENGILLDSIGIREIKFTNEYISAIENKQIEAVKIETEKNKAEAAKYTKEKTITEAEAEAEKQRILRQTLTDEILMNKFYEKWDGKLPLYMGDGYEFLLPKE